MANITTGCGFSFQLQFVYMCIGMLKIFNNPSSNVVTRRLKKSSLLSEGQLKLKISGLESIKLATCLVIVSAYSYCSQVLHSALQDSTMSHVCGGPDILLGGGGGTNKRGG